jgi:hypothetical protein
MSNRKIPRAMFEILEDIEAADLIDNESLIGLIRAETPLAIEEAFKNKKTFATLFEINGLGYFADIPKVYWISALEQCIAFNLEQEKFEECVVLKNLIDQIRKRPKSISKTRKKKENGTRTDEHPNRD